MLAFLKPLFAAPVSEAPHHAYITLVARARNEFFYSKLGVPDTLDGRFELIVLHLFLLQQRLRREGAAAEEFSRQLGEVFLSDMDRSLREIGIGDSGVRHRIKAMAKAYHGRLQAYTASLGEPHQLRGALARNLYGTVENGTPAMLDRMVDYMQATATALEALPLEMLTSGKMQWPGLA